MFCIFPADSVEQGSNLIGDEGVKAIAAGIQFNTIVRELWLVS